jgi:hypothetical protein
MCYKLDQKHFRFTQVANSYFKLLGTHGIIYNEAPFTKTVAWRRRSTHYQPPFVRGNRTAPRSGLIPGASGPVLSGKETEWVQNMSPRNVKENNFLNQRPTVYSVSQSPYHVTHASTKYSECLGRDYFDRLVYW